MKGILILLLFFLSVGCSFGEGIEADTTYAAALKGRADSLSDTGQAFKLLDSAAQIYERYELWGLYLKSRVGQIKALKRSKNEKGAYHFALEVKSFIEPKLNKPLKELASLLLQIGIYHYRYENFDSAKYYFEEQLEVNKQVLSTDDDGLGGNLYNLGKVTYELKMFDKSIDYYLQSISIFEKNKNYRFVGGTYHGIAGIEASLGNEAAAMEYFDKAIVFYKKGDKGIGRNIISVHYEMGNWYLKQFRYREAEEEFRKGVKTAEKYEVKRIEQTALTYYHLGRVMAETGREHEALVFYGNYHSILMDIYGEYNRRSYRSLNVMGNGFLKVGDYKKALEYYQKYLEVIYTFGDTLSELPAIAYVNIALTYKNMALSGRSSYGPISNSVKGTLLKAKEYLLKSKAIYDTFEGKFFMHKGKLNHTLSELQFYLGDRKSAIETLKESILFYSKMNLEINNEQSLAAIRLAQHYLKLGEKDSALSMINLAERKLTGLPEVVSDLSDLNETSFDFNMIQLLGLRANHKIISGDAKKALAYLLKSEELVHSLFKDSPSDEDRLRISERAAPIYSKIALLHYKASL